MYQYTLQELLQTVRPFLENDSFTRFKFELEKVPHLEKTFTRMLCKKPEWMKAVNQNFNRTGKLEVYFHYEGHFLPVWVENERDNELELALMECFKPVIVVKSYRQARSYKNNPFKG